MSTVWRPALQVVTVLTGLITAVSAQNTTGSPQALLQQSVELLKANQPQRALPLLQQAVALDPNNAEARSLIGQVLLDSGQPVQALAQLEVAARLRPADSPTLFSLGVAQFETGRAAQAYETFSRLAAREPGELATRSYLIRTSLRLKKYDAARANLTALRQSAPKEALLHAQLVEWCFEEEGAAITREQIQFTLQLRLPPPQEARVRFLSATLYSRTRQPRDGIPELSRAIVLDDTREQYYSALLKLQSGAGDDSVDRALLARALPKFPDSKDLLITDALLKMRAGEIDEAFRIARHVIEKYPLAPEGFILSGRLQLGNMVYDRAHTDLQRALELNPRDPEAWYYLGICQRRLDRDAQAQTSFEKATALKPAYADAWMEYGRLLYDLGAYQKAGPALATTIKLAPGMAIAYNLMSQTQRKLGKSEEAARYLAQFKKLSARAGAQP